MISQGPASLTTNRTCQACFSRANLHCQRQRPYYGHLSHIQTCRRAVQAQAMAARPPPTGHSAQATDPFPGWLPAEIEEIEEPAALDLARRMQRRRLDVPSLGRAVDTAFVEAGAACDEPPVLLLHGFDGSLLEFRRLLPILAEHSRVLAVDLIGWGFSCGSLESFPDQDLGPQQKTDHLFAFWQSVVQRPMVLVGTSLGCAVATHFARQHPEAVAKLVFAGPQVFVDGIGPMASMPRLLAYLGVQVLRSVPLRSLANRMAYYDTERLATEDAMRIGRLHTHMPGWLNSNIAFMRSGGYSIAAEIRQLTQDTLVIWGKDDGIVESKFAGRFAEDLPHSRLIIVEQCGHCIHLEKPAEMAEHILAFAASAE